MPFDTEKIAKAVYKSLVAAGRAEDAWIDAEAIAAGVLNIVQSNGSKCFVEQVQDLTEQQLMAGGHFEAAKLYILYRDEHRKQREQNPQDAADAAAVRESLAYFTTEAQKLQYFDKYARWNPEKMRRETLPESVDRVITFFQRAIETDQDHGLYLHPDEWDLLRDSMLRQEAFPSMRILQMAGPALVRCEVGAYNCAYLPIDSIFAFCELLYILMQGSGVGFSVESEYVEELPRIKRQKNASMFTHSIPDTTEGWCEALRIGLTCWFDGVDLAFDYSQIRAKGTPLKTKGGRASGPEPLKQLLAFARSRVLARQGKFLTSLDCHDIATMCGQIVQVGGVRRAAEISLSDLDDMDMRNAKAGAFWMNAPQRAMANNSAVYESKPTAVEFMEEWLALAKSGTGERGIMNRESLNKRRPKRRKAAKFGMNPCGEIALRPRQFCNLSIAVARPDDTEESLARKVRIAAIFGTLQSTLTRFNYISAAWNKNCTEERLLGVDITGQMDCPILQPYVYGQTLEPSDREELLKRLRAVAIETNKEFADRLGVPASAAVTCVKPSGNSAQLFGCSSGLHPRYAKFYIRRFRIGAYTPIARLLKESGVPWHPETGQSADDASVLVFELPVKSPDSARTRNEFTALEQLDNWLTWKTHFTEHNPSATIYLNDDEWIDVGTWVYQHWDHIGGLSFLPKDGGVYQLAPYEEIGRYEYEKLAAAMPVVDYSKLSRYEREDMTTVAQEAACVAGVCEL